MNVGKRHEEIGGYLQFEEYYGKEYHSGAKSFKNARSALLYILIAEKVNKVFLPYYLCSCVRETLEKYGFDYDFYGINASFEPVFDKKPDIGEYLYVVNYFGQLDSEKLKKIKDKYGRIIIDNVQAFYQLPPENTSAVYSCRKFFGVPDGGYAYTSGYADVEWNKSFSGKRTEHLIGRFEKGASEYYHVFKANDDGFSNEGPEMMSDFTKNLMRSFDYEKKRLIREENYEIIRGAFEDKNPLILKSHAGPFCYPLYVANGREARKKLAADKIYVPLLWPDLDCEKGSIEFEYSENILPLPCDQRYSHEDMIYLIEKTEEYAAFR